MQSNISTSGKAKFLTRVKVRSSPSTSAESVAVYSEGETVSFDSVVQNEGRTWISYIGGSGLRRYCCAIDTDGEHFIVNVGQSQSNVQVKGDTGFPNIPTQKQFAQRAIGISGCLFLALCVKGGCTTKEECVNAFNWAVSQNLVRANDAYVNISRDSFAQKISSQFNLTYHDDYTIGKSSKIQHFYLLQNGKEIFNSGGLGFGL